MSRQGPPSSRRPGPHNTSHVRIMSCFNECVASLHTTPKSEHLLSFPRLTLEAPARPLDSIQPHCTHMSCTIQPTSKTYTASASSTLQCLALFLECFLASPQTGIVSSVSCPTNRFGEPCPQKTGQVTSRQCLTSLYLWTVPLTCWFFPMQITLYVPPLWASFGLTSPYGAPTCVVRGTCLHFSASTGPHDTHVHVQTKRITGTPVLHHSLMLYGFTLCENTHSLCARMTRTTCADQQNDAWSLRKDDTDNMRGGTKRTFLSELSL